eukprot:13462661-Alexandrium_andersonii.AAC.1
MTPESPPSGGSLQGDPARCETTSLVFSHRGVVLCGRATGKLGHRASRGLGRREVVGDPLQAVAYERDQSMDRAAPFNCRRLATSSLISISSFREPSSARATMSKIPPTSSMARSSNFRRAFR